MVMNRECLILFMASLRWTYCFYIYIQFGYNEPIFILFGWVLMSPSTKCLCILPMKKKSLFHLPTSSLFNPISLRNVILFQANIWDGTSIIMM